MKLESWFGAEASPSLLFFDHLAACLLSLEESPPYLLPPSFPLRPHNGQREAWGRPHGPQPSPCGLPQEGALDLLKKLNSWQMSIQLLQVGGDGQCLEWRVT